MRRRTGGGSWKGRTSPAGRSAYDPTDTQHPHVGRGSRVLAIQQHDTDWVINSFVLRERGIILCGPPPATLIDPIPPDTLKRAVRDLLWWWELQLTDTHRVAQSGYQADAVLTMCRILYTLRHGMVVSRPAAARWACETLDCRWLPLVERALNWPEQPMDRLPETLNLIRHTLACSQASAANQPP